MNSVINKILTFLVLPVAVLGLLYAIVSSVREPVDFNEEKASREAVAIQRLKDLRDLQVAFKNVYGRYSPTVDSLKWFYNEGKMKVVLQVGSKDDSLAVANTKAVTAKIKRQFRRLTPAQLNEKLLQEYETNQTKLVFQIEKSLPVKDTLFIHRADFCVDSLAIIPFSGDSLEMASTIKTVSGVKVPLFEAKVPYNSLLIGMDKQLLINLNAEKNDMGHYPGLMVGSIDQPNNNAGNWE